MIRIITIIISLVFLCNSPVSAVSEIDFSERVNLALRKTGHILLQEKGDSTTSISPVQNEDSRYSIQLPKLNYDLLPYVFQDALKECNVEATYRVLVYKCDNDTIVLGYHSNDLKAKNVTCQGRQFEEGCYDVIVHFENAETTTNNLRHAGWIPLLLFFTLGAFLLFHFRKDETFVEASVSNPDLIHIGSYSYDMQNQKLEHANFQKQLTHRENKLLSLLVNHQNQLVERTTINDQIWGEEGVIVGRSLDVFISRLRKYFSHDENITIKNVHGVGYRLDISTR